MKLMSARLNRIYLMGMKFHTYVNPPFISFMILSFALDKLLALIFIDNRASSTARKLIPLIRKQVPSLVMPMRTPATDGPKSLAPLKRKEFSAIALPRSALLSSSSTTKDCLMGISKELIRPSKKLRIKRCQISIRPLRARKASARACSMAQNCVAITMRYRFRRSA